MAILKIKSMALTHTCQASLSNTKLQGRMDTVVTIYLVTSLREQCGWPCCEGPVVGVVVGRIGHVILFCFLGARVELGALP